MKKIVLLCAIIVSLQATAQTIEKNVYNPTADAAKDITEAVKKAKAEKKHVLIQVGGNWCSWCLEFNRFCKTDPQIDSLLKADYIVYHLNYSKENTNEALFAKYGFPQRFGFPVFIILDETGNRLHTQNSAYLEQGKSYHKENVLAFFKAWNYKATDPATYKKGK